MKEIARGPVGIKIPTGWKPGVYGYKNGSPEGCNIYSKAHQAVITIFQLDNVSDPSTGLRQPEAPSTACQRLISRRLTPSFLHDDPCPPGRALIAVLCTTPPDQSSSHLSIFGGGAAALLFQFFTSCSPDQ